MICQLHTPKMWWHQSRHFLQSTISHNTNIPQHVTLQLISEFPPRPYVEDPTPLCDGVSLQGLWGVIWFRQGPEHGAPMMGWVSLLKRRRTKLILELCEDAVRRRPSAHRERALTRNQTTMASDLGLPRVQSCGEPVSAVEASQSTLFCCGSRRHLGQPVCDSMNEAKLMCSKVVLPKFQSFHYHLHDFCPLYYPVIFHVNHFQDVYAFPFQRENATPTPEMEAQSHWLQKKIVTPSQIQWKPMSLKC